MSKSRLTVLIITGLILAVFVIPYLYNKWVQSPSHSAARTGAAV